MTPQFLQLIRFLKERDRPVNFGPTPITPTSWSIQCSRMQQALSELHRGVDFINQNPSRTLELLTTLSVEVLATYLLLGLSEVYAKGILAYTTRSLSEPQPNFKVIVDEEYQSPFEDEQSTQ